MVASVPAVTLAGPVDDWRSYDRVAETYERVHAPRMREPANDLAAIVAPPTGATVLDVGTGTGVAAEVVSEAVGPTGVVVGLDVSLGMLGVARRVRPGIRTVAAEAIDLPFRDGTFEVVLGNFVLAHFTKVDTALFDILRVLRPGGRLGLTAWADGPDDLQNAWLDLVRSVVPQEMLEPALGHAAPGHDRFRKRAAIEEALIDAGLRHVRSETRRYRFVSALDDYVEGLAARALGRFVRDMLDDDEWTELLARAHVVFADRFADPVNDFREVNLAVGTKP
jgi:ubiquinone/menaquinone biosynthesis C-methylase UbiE